MDIVEYDLKLKYKKYNYKDYENMPESIPTESSFEIITIYSEIGTFSKVHKSRKKCVYIHDIL